MLTVYVVRDTKYIIFILSNLISCCRSPPYIFVSLDRLLENWIEHDLIRFY